MKKNIDEVLKKSGVRFLPWIGENYENGISYDENGIIQYGTPENKGKKILVLGESHYCADEKDATDDLTRSVIKDFIDPDSVFEPYKNTYTKFERALAGRTLVKEEQKSLWEHIVFYNYVQRPLSAARISPTEDDFEISENPFWEILSILKPDLIIVWGNRLYYKLPQQGYQGEDIEINDDFVETWVLNDEIKMLPIIHPAAPMFIPTVWNDVIVKLFKL